MPIPPPQSLRDLGFAFLFAPAFHPAMKHAGPTRREIGIRTAFNLIGPLTNPAGATRALIGVGDAAAAARIAEVAGLLGTERTTVVHGDGVDELPLDGTGVAYDVANGAVEMSTVDPTALGLEPAPTSALAGGTADENAAIIESIFARRDGAAARRRAAERRGGAGRRRASAADLADGHRRGAECARHRACRATCSHGCGPSGPPRPAATPAGAPA